MGKEMNSNYHNLTSRLNLWLLRSQKRFRSICAIFQYFYGLSFTQNNGRSRKKMVVHARFTLIHAVSRGFALFHVISCWYLLYSQKQSGAHPEAWHLAGSDFGFIMNYYIYNFIYYTYITLFHNIFQQGAKCCFRMIEMLLPGKLANQWNGVCGWNPSGTFGAQLKVWPFAL